MNYGQIPSSALTLSVPNEVIVAPVIWNEPLPPVTSWQVGTKSLSVNIICCPLIELPYEITTV